MKMFVCVCVRGVCVCMLREEPYFTENCLIILHLMAGKLLGSEVISEHLISKNFQGGHVPRPP